ncbi:MAG: hypothetical protein AAF633_00580 [Chloroflexota bacterium]
MNNSNDNPSPSGSSRRRFLRTAAAAAAASCVTGAGMAYYQRQVTGSAVQTVAGPTAVPTIPPLPQIDTASDLRTELQSAWERLAASEAENVRLRAELDAANRRLEAMTSTSDGQTETLEVMKSEISTLQEENILLGGLVALYEQLEDIDLYAPISAGLSTINEAWDNLWDDVPTVEEGLDFAEQVLAQFDNDVDMLGRGRVWLSRQIERLDGIWEGLETILNETQETVGPLLDMLWGWFERVRRWLPLGLGSTSERIMTSLAEMVDELPLTTSGMVGEVAIPLDRWFAQDSESSDVIIRNRLFKPMRERVVPQVVAMVSKTNDVRSKYDTELVSQLSPVISRRKQQERTIRLYREEYNLRRS